MRPRGHQEADGDGPRHAHVFADALAQSLCDKRARHLDAVARTGVIQARFTGSGKLKGQHRFRNSAGTKMALTWAGDALKCVDDRQKP